MSLGRFSFNFRPRFKNPVSSFKINGEDITVTIAIGNSSKSHTEKIMSFKPEDYLSESMDNSLDFFHEDVTNYQPILTKLDKEISSIASKMMDRQTNIKVYQAKIAECVNYMKNDFKSYYYVKRNHKFMSNYVIYAYPVLLAGVMIESLMRQYFLPENGTVIMNRDTGEKFKNDNYSSLMRMSGVKFFNEGVQEYLSIDCNKNPLPNSWFTSRFGSMFDYTTEKHKYFVYEGPYIQGKLAYSLWLGKFGFPYMGTGAVWPTKIVISKYRWPWFERYLSTDGEKSGSALLHILNKYIAKYTRLIKDQSIYLQMYNAQIKELQKHKAYYATLALFRDNFNTNINDPEFINFPSIDELSNIADKNNIPMSVAFLVFNDDHSYQNINFAYPRFVADLAIYNCVKSEKKNFNDLTNERKKLYLVSAVKYISDNIYLNDELQKTIEYRINLIDKYYETFKKIDGDIVRVKVDRMVKAVKDGQVITSDTIGRAYNWFGFANKETGVHIADDSMSGFWPVIKISLPKITLPEIRIPKINIINIVLPKNINPIEGMISLIGGSDESKYYMTKVSNSIVNQPIYVPVVSEVVDTGSQIVSSVAKTTEQFVASTPEMVAGVVKASGGLVNAVIISPAGQLIDGIAYAILPPDVAKKIDTITDLPSKAVTGKLTAEDIKDAGQSVMKLAIAPLAFSGKITADIIDTAKNNISLINDLDRYSGGLLSSASNVSRAGHVEYEGKAHDPALLLDAVKIGLVILMAGSVSVLISNTATTVATSAVMDKTGVGGDEAKALVTAYQTGDVSAVATGYAQDKAIKEGSKQIAKSTGLPMEDVIAVGQGVQSGKSVSQSLLDAGKSKAKRRINDDIKKKTGLPITIDDVMSTDPSNKKSLIQEMKHYAKNPDKLKELIRKESALAMEKERERIQRESDKILRLKESIKNFDTKKELTILQKNASKEIDKRVEDAKEFSKNVEREWDEFNADDANDDLAQKAREEKDRSTKRLYKDFYNLPEKYFPDEFLNYLMYQFGPKPDYDQYITEDMDWGSFDWEMPKDGTQFKNDPNKNKFTGAKIAGVILAGYAGYKVATN